MAQSKNKTNINGPEELEKKSIVYQLHELIKPYILRRVKADVALELPPKVTKNVFFACRYLCCCFMQRVTWLLTLQVEKIVYCPLSALQRVAYELFRTRVRTSAKSSLKNHIAEAEDDVFGPYEKALMNANNLLMQLRKLCNHPYLVLEDVQTIPDALYYQHLLSSSGKLFVLDKLLSPLLQQGSKVCSCIFLVTDFF